MPSQKESWRSLSKWERETLDRMLQEPVEGRDELRAQLNSARVRTIDETGSLRFQASANSGADQNPVIARGEDQDRIPIEMLLLVGEDGRIAELDIWKGDGSPIERRPEPSSLRILIRSPSGMVE